MVGEEDPKAIAARAAGVEVQRSRLSDMLLPLNPKRARPAIAPPLQKKQKTSEAYPTAPRKTAQPTAKRRAQQQSETGQVLLSVSQPESTDGETERESESGVDMPEIVSNLVSCLDSKTTWAPDRKFCPFITDPTVKRIELNSVLYSKTTKELLETERAAKFAMKPKNWGDMILAKFAEANWDPLVLGPNDQNLVQTYSVEVLGTKQDFVGLKFPLSVKPHPHAVIIPDCIMEALVERIESNTIKTQKPQRNKKRKNDSSDSETSEESDDRVRRRRIRQISELRKQLTKEVIASLRNQRNHLKVLPIVDPDHPAYQSEPDHNGCHGYGCGFRSAPGSKTIDVATIVCPPYAGILRPKSETDKLEWEVDQIKSELPYTRWQYSFQIDNASFDDLFPQKYAVQVEKEQNQSNEELDQAPISEVVPGSNFVDSIWASGLSVRSALAVTTSETADSEEKVEWDLDAYEVRNVASYVNDTLGLAEAKTKQGETDTTVKDNLMSVACTVFGIPHIFFVTTRKVYNGEEAFLHYGQPYWESYESREKFMRQMRLMNARIKDIAADRKLWLDREVQLKTELANNKGAELEETQRIDAELKNVQMKIIDIDRMRRQTETDIIILKRRDEFRRNKTRHHRRCRIFRIRKELKFVQTSLQNQKPCLCSVIAKILEHAEVHEIGEATNESTHYMLHCPFWQKYQEYLEECDECRNFYYQGDRANHVIDCAEKKKYVSLWDRQNDQKMLFETEEENRIKMEKTAPAIFGNQHRFNNFIFDLTNSSGHVAAFLSSRIRKYMVDFYTEAGVGEPARWFDDLCEDLGVSNLELSCAMCEISTVAGVITGPSRFKSILPKIDDNESWVFPFALEWLKIREQVLEDLERDTSGNIPAPPASLSNPLLRRMMVTFRIAEEKILSSLFPNQHDVDEVKNREAIISTMEKCVPVSHCVVEFLEPDNQIKQLFTHARLRHELLKKEAEALREQKTQTSPFGVKQEPDRPPRFSNEDFRRQNQYRRERDSSRRRKHDSRYDSRGRQDSYRQDFHDREYRQDGQQEQKYYEVKQDEKSEDSIEIKEEDDEFMKSNK